jgi:hypothetical protein
VVNKVALGQVYSEYFGFPCQFPFRQILHTHLSSGAGKLGQLVADVPSGLSLAPPPKVKKLEWVILPSLFPTMQLQQMSLLLAMLLKLNT